MIYKQGICFQANTFKSCLKGHPSSLALRRIIVNGNELGGRISLQVFYRVVKQFGSDSFAAMNGDGMDRRFSIVSFRWCQTNKPNDLGIVRRYKNRLRLCPIKMSSQR